MNSKLLTEILDLSTAERIRLAQEIWDSVTEVPDSSILTDWQKQELQIRLNALNENPASGIPWREVISDLKRSK